MPSRSPANIVAPVRSNSIDLTTVSIDRYHRTHAPDRRDDVRRTSRPVVVASSCRRRVVLAADRHRGAIHRFLDPQICGSTGPWIHRSVDPLILGSTAPRTSRHHRGVIAPSSRHRCAVLYPRPGRHDEPGIHRSLVLWTPWIHRSVDPQMHRSVDPRTCAVVF